MDTLQHQLTELAKQAPTGGSPPAELWARGQRTHRIRVAALAATVLVMGAVGIGVRIADVNFDRSHPSPVDGVGITLPIEYPLGEELPGLGDTPGPLAAIWLTPRVGSPGGAPEVVGLVAKTGTFGTLPINLLLDDPEDPGSMVVALSPDGRRMAYSSPTGELVVHDLVSGENDSPLSEFGTRAGFTWVDATHLVGYVAGGSDADGWEWEPGATPKLVDNYTYAEGFDLWVSQQGGGPQPWPGEDSCSAPVLLDATGEYGEYTPGWGYTLEVPELCDVLGVIGSKLLLGHWNSDRSSGDWGDPNDGNRTVVALDVEGADEGFEDPSLRRVVATSEAPDRVTFATDLIGEALNAMGAS